MEEKGDVCDRSEEVAALLEELSVFINATKTEQMDRVVMVCLCDRVAVCVPHLSSLSPSHLAPTTSTQLKETSNYLQSNHLSELSQQISLSTEHTFGEFELTRSSLEKLHQRLVQIEGEKEPRKKAH